MEPENTYLSAMTQDVGQITAWMEVPARWGRPARRFVFGKPLEIWTAHRLEDVRPALERVEASQQLGKFVVGWISYEAAPAFDRAMKTPHRDDFPLCWFASFAMPLAEPLSVHSEPPIAVTRPTVSLDVSEADYLSRVGAVRRYIERGDVYQVNHTVRASVDNLSDSFDFFLDRLRAVPVPHAAYLDSGNWQILSLSPELFLRRAGEVLESRPMKGTAARRPSWRDDEAARVALQESTKERAENTMIVDLVRNDLGRVCRSGSVHVPEWCVVSRFPTVHQMTSLVRGELRPNVTLFEMFQALFPPGSVTGAPKIRAMEIISELEPEPRGVYCGTIGLFFPGGDFECNVAIRTVQTRKTEDGVRKADDSAFNFRVSGLGLGSGIVADSDPAAEWRETLLKGTFLTQEPLPEFLLIETLAWTPEEGYRNLDRHLTRLRNSAEYFGWGFPMDRIRERLREYEESRIGRQEKIDTQRRVRILLSEDDGVELEDLSLEQWPEGGTKLCLYREEPVDPENVFLYHKTTQRAIYDRAAEAAQAAGADDAVLVNTRGEITETTRANLMVKIRGEWTTPALRCGLLPGIWRKLQLEAGRCREGVITVEKLLNAEAIIVGNSARGETKCVVAAAPRGRPN